MNPSLEDRLAVVATARTQLSTLTPMVRGAFSNAQNTATKLLPYTTACYHQQWLDAIERTQAYPSWDNVLLVALCLIDKGALTDRERAIIERIAANKVRLLKKEGMWTEEEEPSILTNILR